MGSRLDRRTTVRYVCGPDRLLTAAVGYDGWPASVRDLSAGGISLLSSRPLEKGARLPVTLGTPSRSCTRDVQVTHATPVAPGCWVIGARFATHLSTEELLVFLTRLKTGPRAP